MRYIPESASEKPERDITKWVMFSVGAYALGLTAYILLRNNYAEESVPRDSNQRTEKRLENK